MRVLIVEDDAAARRLLRFVLEDVGGHQVVEACDGQQGRALAPECDLVITDLLMPNLDGYALCKALRARSPVPIIAMSAQDRLNATSSLMPVNERLTKPFEIKSLYTIVARWISAA